MSTDTLDPKIFKRILARNVALPLAMSVVLCGVFVGLVLYLMSVSRWVDHTDRVIGSANHVLKLIVDSETAVRGYLLTKKDNYLEPYRIASEAIPGEMKTLTETVSDNPVQVKRLEALWVRYNIWKGSADDSLDRKRSDPNFRVIEGADLRAQEMDRIRAGFQEFISLEENLRLERGTAANDFTKLLILVTVFLSIFVGGIIAYTGRRQLLSLSENYEDALLKQLQQNDLLNRQAWLRTGQADLSDRILGELATSELANRILSFLIDRLEAKVGALYLVHEDYLARQATYAFSDNGKHAGETIKVGEGLVGQVARDRKPLVLSDVPADYLKISSSLGNMSPKHLVIFPFRADGVVNSVVELGFVDPPNARTLEFLNLVCENSGIAIQSSEYRAKLQDLLHESQQLTEELQTQQEELRTSNEELSEQTKALQEAQTRLEGQHAELEQANDQLEEQTQELERQKSNVDLQNSQLREIQIAVEQKARELEAANQYKSEFLANMSHELRTPLNSSLILAKLLKDNEPGNLSPEQVEFASTIYGAGNDLLDLINDILDLSKVEAGKLEIQSEKVALSRISASLERTFKPVADQRKLNFTVRIEKSAPEFIETDRQRLEQIVKNLLSNAFKFTSKGGVEFLISARAPAQIVFTVKDTGVGIDSSQREVIFEAFRQADGTINRKYGGTGLGLTISKNLSRLLGGSIEVDSVVGQGSTFSLILPEKYDGVATQSEPPIARAIEVTRAEKPKPAENRKAGPAPFQDDRDLPIEPGRKTLLIVEDESKFSKILFDLAHELGFRALVAVNAADGYLLATEYYPSAIILDMKLPDGLGLALLDRLKQNPKTRHIPVHAISVADYSREAKSLGAVGYALKPANREELKETFRKLEEKINQQIKRVLLVEDDDVQRASIQRLIGEKGVEIVSVGHGTEALKKLKSETFDCMVIDLSLPDMTGFELLQTMSRGEDIAFPPVIVYTGRSLTRAEEDELRKYSRTIIIKGARSPERLLDEVTLFLHQIESQMTPERQKMLKESRSREKAFEGRKILLADDDVRNIFALTAALEARGAKVMVARNGREALEQLAEEPVIDLVLMDIMMPEMDGYQATRAIRKQPEFSKLPIIAVTAKAMRDDYEKCLEAGANDYLAKPIDVEKLISLMRVWLPKPIGRA